MLDIRPTSELALGEFATYEFSIDAYKTPVIAAFSGIGTGVTAFDSGIRQGVVFNVVGKTTTRAVGLAIHQSAFNTAGSAEVSAFMQELRSAAFNSYSFGSVDGQTGIGVSAAFNTVSESSAVFYSVEGYGFDVISGAKVVFHTDVTHSVNFSGSGSALGNGVGQVVVESASTTAAASIAVGNAQVITFTDYLVNAQSSSNFKGQWTQQTSYTVTAGATTRAGIQVINQGTYATKGIAAVFSSGAVVYQAGFQSNGVANSAFSTTMVVLADAHSYGSSALSGFGGSPVYAYLPNAWDRVIRPAEVRTVFKPIEIRKATWK